MNYKSHKKTNLEQAWYTNETVDNQSCAIITVLP